MSTKQEEAWFDPFGAWRSLRDNGVEAWSNMMVEFVNSEAYAQATGAVLDAWLTSSAPLRKALSSAMTQVLIQLNMPTRTDVLGLAERLTNIELRLDDLEATWEEYWQALAQARPAREAEPS